jgi:hypothetical protein
LLQATREAEEYKKLLAQRHKEEAERKHAKKHRAHSHSSDA